MIATLEELVIEAADLLAALRLRELRIATAESCTGGLIAAVLTEVPGSSEVFERGFVTYSNTAKMEDLGVSAELIQRLGAVSREVAEAMAIGTLERSKATVSVAVTGVAGPGGGSSAKPVGLVHLAAAGGQGNLLHKELQLGEIGRREIRLATVGEALGLVRALL